MLKIQNPEHFTQVVEFAINAGCAAKLFDRLAYLANYGGNPEYTVCTLGYDFAPHSFRFTIERNGNRWFNGGLIYSGPTQALDGSFPALTVSLEPGDGSHQWSVHT